MCVYLYYSKSPVTWAWYNFLLHLVQDSTGHEL